MTYKVEITASALQDLTDVVEYITANAGPMSSKWLREFEVLASSLSEMPQRFAEIPEAPVFRISYRSAHHYSHRIIYRIDEEAECVYIVRVYHRARKPLQAKDILG